MLKDLVFFAASYDLLDCFLTGSESSIVAFSRSALREGVFSGSHARLEKELRGNTETAAEALDVVFVQFTLSGQDFRDDAGGAENVYEVLLLETMLIHQHVQHFERFRAGQVIALFLEVLDQ